MPELYELLALDPDQRRQVAQQSERLATISETLSIAVEKVQDSKALESLGRVFPWVAEGVDIAGEALPPVKAAAKLIQKVTSIDDPLSLGLIACTTAYQQAAVESLSLFGRPAAAIGFYSDDAK